MRMCGHRQAIPARDGSQIPCFWWVYWQGSNQVSPIPHENGTLTLIATNRPSFVAWMERSLRSAIQVLQLAETMIMAGVKPESHSAEYGLTAYSTLRAKVTR